MEWGGVSKDLWASVLSVGSPICMAGSSLSQFQEACLFSLSWQVAQLHHSTRVPAFVLLTLVVSRTLVVC